MYVLDAFAMFTMQKVYATPGTWPEAMANMYLQKKATDKVVVVVVLGLRQGRGRGRVRARERERE